MTRFTPGSVIALALAAVYIVRAGIGLPAGHALRRGYAASEAGRYAEAAAELAHAGAGADREAAFWWDAEARLGLWDATPAPDQLERATGSFLGGFASSPASGWYFSGIAEVYERREKTARGSRTFDLADVARGPWHLIGDDGRIAIGLVRMAIEREPTTAHFRDDLVQVLESNGMRDAALEAIRESARVLPDFGAHAYFSFDSLPRELAEAFYLASREQVGEAPLQFRERHLLSLGILARRLGRLADAETDLRAALASPGTALFHAEDAFHLGLTLLDLGREDEAESMFGRAREFEVFRDGILSARASHEESRGRLDAALEELSTLRARQPQDLGICLWYAEVSRRAGQTSHAEEALRFAIVLAPEDVRPRRALVRLYLDTGRRPQAAAALEDLRAHGDKGAELEAMAREVEGSAP